MGTSHVHIHRSCPTIIHIFPRKYPLLPRLPQNRSPSTLISTPDTRISVKSTLSHHSLYLPSYLVTRLSRIFPLARSRGWESNTWHGKQYWSPKLSKVKNDVLKMLGPQITVQSCSTVYHSMAILVQRYW